MKTMSPPRLLPQWLCNSCSWTQAHDVHLVCIYIYIIWIWPKLYELCKSCLRTSWRKKVMFHYKEDFKFHYHLFFFPLIEIWNLWNERGKGDNSASSVDHFWKWWLYNKLSMTISQWWASGLGKSTSAGPTASETRFWYLSGRCL